MRRELRIFTCALAAGAWLGIPIILVLGKAVPRGTDIWIGIATTAAIVSVLYERMG